MTMTEPDVPLRLELSFELPGTPEQVWDAIATAHGISSWFLPTDLEERDGGSVCFHMGDEDSSPGTVTGWDPPRRFAIVEPEWAALGGQDPASVTPMATEFLVEARSGGTCVVHIVSSAFGSGADWEQEFFDEMEKGWLPFFDNLRLYLTHFPGQRATSLTVSAPVAGDAGRVWSALRQAVGATELGSVVDVRGLTGRVVRLGGPPAALELLVQLDGPMPGFVGFSTYEQDAGVATASIQGYLFSPEAAAYVAQERDSWKVWLAGLAVSAG
jgi:uncharacterized protein YndB with AHSA1/START domain